MPPKASQSSSQAGGGPKQTSLLGFFTKPKATPSSSSTSNTQQRVPQTPATSAAGGSLRGSGARTSTPASTSSEAVEKRRQAILAATEGSPTAVTKKLPESITNGKNKVSEDKSTTKATLSKPNGVTTNGKPGPTQEKKQNKKVTVDSDVTFGSSPLSAVELMDDDDERTIIGGMAVDVAKENEGESQGSGNGNKAESGNTSGLGLNIRSMESEEDGKGPRTEGGNEDDDEQPVRSSRRASKRKVAYIESNDEDSDDSSVEKRESSKESSAAPKPRTSTSARKKSKVADEDDFEFDDGGMDDEELDVMMTEFESPTKSTISLAETDEEETFTSKKSASKAKSTTTSNNRAKAAIPQRPPVKPLAGGNASSTRMNSGSGVGGAGGGFMTQAERSKIDAKEKKAAEQDCFEFLRNLKDIVDQIFTTLMLALAGLFWLSQIIRNMMSEQCTSPQRHGTHSRRSRDRWASTPSDRCVAVYQVLFFQKGKFYELYEKDAEIGHNEFDLKLTDRVKMKMVGVPEQSFDFWCAKFLAAGYKVGKVEQAETAIGMEMRTKAAAGKPKNKADSIVRRELATVLTNGTVVDEAFLSGDEACHCIAIKSLPAIQKEGQSDAGNATYGICILDAATGRFELTAFEDDVCRTKLETLFRQLRPRELIYSKGNLGVVTSRLLRNILPMNASWVSLKPETEFYDENKTRRELATFFGSKDTSDAEDVEMADDTQNGIPEAITSMLDKPLAIEALGGMMFYLRSLNMANDLLSQRSFNVYDPIRKGENLVLDGQTLSHLEILVNNEGGEEGTLLELLQRCVTPFGKRLFRIWLTVPLQKIDAISASDFLKVMSAFKKLNKGFSELASLAKTFDSTSVDALLRGAPDMTANLDQTQSMYELMDNVILPNPGASEECDEARVAVEDAEAALDEILESYKEQLRCNDLTYWHSAQGAKDIYVLQVPAKIKVPANWTKTGGTKAHNKYVTSKTQPLIREVQEARETKKMAFQGFYAQLLQEFDRDRDVWLRAVRIFAELDCLLSLAKASADLDEPRCRPELVESEEAFIDFRDLRHPALCLRSDFISNDVQLGRDVPRQTLLTGPNTAGKSTLCRMTSVAVIMAQLGALVPASEARQALSISPIDKIQTRMGAYDNMFSSSSTFKVELDECAKILREGGPKSLVILDELGRGTSTYDGMAIAEAVLHHLSTATLPLGFFATHYGALTDDFQYHPNVRCMHMQTQVDDEKREVICLYKLIEGRAESSYGTHVAHLAGVPNSVVARAEQVSSEFFANFKQKMASRRKSDLPVLAQADFNWLYKSATTPRTELSSTFLQQLALIKNAIGRYEH
ncbi:hypothetical protein QFC22_004311 [Naganishia vaughanmartiniae]|uniref:Uncharacterized protein n=1 Tax=Naganishia vaughanmartiniae TaxID=1424756 RepID=A0ACC2X334_9TREE|nr:hypothetical protein QFC22_004311 [Naganishia vaughanmartiniae]